MKQKRANRNKNVSEKPRVNDIFTLTVDKKIYTGKVSSITSDGVFVKPDSSMQIDAQPVFLPLFLLFGLRNGIGRWSGGMGNNGGFGGMGGPGGFGNFGNRWMGQQGYGGFGGVPQRGPWGFPGQGNAFGGGGGFGGNMGGGQFGVGNMLKSMLW